MGQVIRDDSRREIRLVQPIGRGGFGVVFLADVRSEDGLTQRLAVKILNQQFAEHAEIAARARDEARLLSQLNDDHVVTVHALTQLGGRAVVLMEYVEGVDAQTLMECSRSAGDGGLPPVVACAIAERVASALKAAWRSTSPETGKPLQVIHRDIKPSNILVSASGAVKVLDFGVARANVTREAVSKSVQYGTARYMAPERLTRGLSTHQSDVYALGVTLFELLTGQRLDQLPMSEELFNLQLAVRLDALRQRAVIAPHADFYDALLREMLAYHVGNRVDAATVEQRLAEHGDALTGVSLRRYCKGVVPGLVKRQLAKMQEDKIAWGAVQDLGQELPEGQRRLPRPPPRRSLAAAPAPAPVAKPAPPPAPAAKPAPAVKPAPPERGARSSTRASPGPASRAHSAGLLPWMTRASSAPQLPSWLPRDPDTLLSVAASALALITILASLSMLSRATLEPSSATPQTEPAVEETP